MSKFSGRIRIFSRAIPRLLGKPWRRAPHVVRRVLVVHRLLLGDTLLLAPLLKKLRQQYPDAEIALTCPPLIAILFAGSPYGVKVLPYDPRSDADVGRIIASGPYDLAIAAGDQRYSWLALAAGSGWIIAHDSQAPWWKRMPIDDARPFPQTPIAWADAMALLIDGPAPAPFTPAEWPMPNGNPFVQPRGHYAVLHPGASNAAKQWVPQRWMALAQWLAQQGIEPVWSAGPSEAALVREVDPACRFHSYASQIDLAQLASLLQGARLLVCPDTGIAHLGRVVGVPTLALFGPGNAGIHGAGAFWARSAFIAETLTDLDCRNQRSMFDMKVDWIRRCDRDLDSCINRRGNGTACMVDISEGAVETHLNHLMHGMQ